MKYAQKRRNTPAGYGPGNSGLADNDPLGGVANLFDIGLVFIVGLILTLFSAYHLEDLFDQNSEFTMMKKDSKGRMEIITKSKNKIEAMKVSEEQTRGEGQRLGVAYQLEDGSMVYVPD